jgi:hypothetical protein
MYRRPIMCLATGAGSKGVEIRLRTIEKVLVFKACEDRRCQGFYERQTEVGLRFGASAGDHEPRLERS